LTNAHSTIKDNQSEFDFKQNILGHLRDLVSNEKNKDIKVHK